MAGKIGESEQSAKYVGKAVNRVDGHSKVTGAATYAAEHKIDDLVYAALIQSTIAKGTITKMDTSEAERLPGVKVIITPFNAPRLSSKSTPSGRSLLLLQDKQVQHDRQNIGLVIADTWESASHAASLVKVSYKQTEPQVEIEKHATYEKLKSTTSEIGKQISAAGHKRGDFSQAFASGAHKVDQIYSTPMESHNPMEPFAVIASWEGEHLTLYDTTQAVFATRKTVAEHFDIPESHVRIISPFVGGGFGSKLSTWSHVILAAMAARKVNLPVKLVLSRAQMYGPVGFRPKTIQRILLAADKNGKLTAIRHDNINETSHFEDYVEASTHTTSRMYACPNLITSQNQVALDIGTPTWMRAPGEAPGSFALESAMDELAYELGLDPIELRVRNYPEKDPESGLPWSSNSLRECYKVGAEKFGWHKRNPEPKSMRAGKDLLGWGMAAATYPTYRMAANAQVTILPSGEALVQAGSQDIGTGTYTIMSQVAADTLGLPIEKIKFELGDSTLPRTPLSGGSMTAASVGSAVQLACQTALNSLIKTAIADQVSPLYQAKAESIVARDEGLYLSSDSKKGERLTDIIKRNKLKQVVGKAESKPGNEDEKYSMHSYGAIFAEVKIDSDLVRPKLTRMVGAYGAGKILNLKTARNQMFGGMTFGIGMALMEHTLIDPKLGRIMNADLAEYHLPVNLDVPNLDVIFIDEHDPHINPLGAKGIGEISITGVAAAIANAVYHATGKRIRDLPITIDKIM
jgi:xanthine dehydrogenase YagR molybdenum-binding subunit